MTDRLTVLADSYLDHIRIAVQAGDRGAPFRNFVDNWNAFRSAHGHHRSRGNRPRWFNNPNAAKRSAMLESLDLQARSAAAIIDGAKAAPAKYRPRYLARDTSIKLIVDHAMPVSALVDMLFRPGADVSRDGVRNHLTRWYRLGLLTHNENRRLDAAGLNCAMPADWDGEEVFARDHRADVEEA